MNALAIIDLNVRVRGNHTYIGFEDLRHVEPSQVKVGQQLDVLEEESGLQGRSEVMDIDAEKRLIFLAVPWSELRVPRNSVRSA